MHPLPAGPGRGSRPWSGCHGVDRRRARGHARAGVGSTGRCHRTRGRAPRPARGGARPPRRLRRQPLGVRGAGDRLYSQRLVALACAPRLRIMPGGTGQASWCMVVVVVVVAGAG